MSSIDDDDPAFGPVRPELRRPPLDEVAIYRVRVDLDHAEPPIWRLLDLSSVLPLDVVHQVLQAVFGWTDSHLHRFSLGGLPFDRTSQLFLCPYDVAEGEVGEDGDIAAADVRLDETLQEPGDVLAYVYDYGDSWEVTLRLEEVIPASALPPSAVAVDGQGAAPPEDSGGGTDRASIALVVDDPDYFDLDQVNAALRAPYFVLREYGVDPRLVDLVNRLSYTDVGADLAQRMLILVTEPTEPTEEEMVEALRAHRWFLDRAQGAGIELTTAGYLKPADVEAAAEVVPVMGGAPGKHNRESHARPLLWFRESLREMGLLRKHKDKLVLTRAGAAGQRDPATLWAHLADRLAPAKTADDFVIHASLLLLAYAGTSPDAAVPRKQVVLALSELGWRHADGRPLEGFYELNRLVASTTLVNLSKRPTSLLERDRLSPTAAALARAALRRHPAPQGLPS